MGEIGGRPGEGTGVDTREDLRHPRLFKVVIHNDDYTTMEFVVEVLCSVFRRTLDDAVGIMLNVHHNGAGLCGVYPAEVAETKADTVHSMATEQGFPLRCSVEPE